MQKLFKQACAPGSAPEPTLTLGGKIDPRMGGGPLTLDGEVVCLTNGRFIAYGPMGGGVERNYGPSMVFRVGGIDIIVITNNGQATDLGQFTSLGIDPTRYTHGRGQVDAAFPRRLRTDRPRSDPRRHRRLCQVNLHARAVHQGAPSDLAARPDHRPAHPTLTLWPVARMAAPQVAGARRPGWRAADHPLAGIDKGYI